MNTFGRKFRVSIFGESHGELIGVVMDGVPAGLELSEQDFEQDILRRKSGAKGTTPKRRECAEKLVSAHSPIHFPVIDFVQIAHARHSSSKLGSALTQSQFSRRFLVNRSTLFVQRSSLPVHQYVILNSFQDLTASRYMTKDNHSPRTDAETSSA